MNAPFIRHCTAHVLFLLVAQERHVDGLRQAIDSSLLRWEGQIIIMELAKKPMHEANDTNADKIIPIS